MYLLLRHVSCALDLVKINTQENFGMEALVKMVTFKGVGRRAGEVIITRDVGEVRFGRSE